MQFFKGELSFEKMEEVTQKILDISGKKELSQFIQKNNQRKFGIGKF